MLAAEVWRARQAAHEARVDAWTASHLARRRRGEGHPVWDFLWTYYTYRPAQLRRWHAGVGVALENADDRLGWRGYVAVDGGVTVDLDALGPRGPVTARWVRDLLVRTAERPAQLGCFGLHEWAMVYQATGDQVRHTSFPLRLGPAGTDAVVEALHVRCSHFDAYRFFTPAAAPRNALQPTRERQPELEQPGCLHAGMDLYKWAYQLAPLTPSVLVADCFALARDLRELDMRAAPYDLSSLGIAPVRVETPEGRAAYVAAQRALAERGAALRTRLVEVCDAALAAAAFHDHEPLTGSRTVNAPRS